MARCALAESAKSEPRAAGIGLSVPANGSYVQESRVSSCSAAARCTAGGFPGSPGSTSSRACSSTATDGTTATRVEIRRAACQARSRSWPGRGCPCPAWRTTTMLHRSCPSHHDAPLWWLRPEPGCHLSPISLAQRLINLASSSEDLPGRFRTTTQGQIPPTGRNSCAGCIRRLGCGSDRYSRQSHALICRSTRFQRT